RLVAGLRALLHHPARVANRTGQAAGKASRHCPRAVSMASVLGINDFGTYLIGTIAIVLLPGPNSLYVLSTAARHGVRAGYRAAAGVFVGDWVLMLAAVAGVASLLRAYPPLFLVIKYGGAAYLAYVGITMVVGAWRRRRDRPTTAVTPDPTAPDPTAPDPTAPDPAMAGAAVADSTVADSTAPFGSPA